MLLPNFHSAFKLLTHMKWSQWRSMKDDPVSLHRCRLWTLSCEQSGCVSCRPEDTVSEHFLDSSSNSSAYSHVELVFSTLEVRGFRDSRSPSLTIFCWWLTIKCPSKCQSLRGINEMVHNINTNTKISPMKAWNIYITMFNNVKESEQRPNQVKNPIHINILIGFWSGPFRKIFDSKTERLSVPIIFLNGVHVHTHSDPVTVSVHCSCLLLIRDASPPLHNICLQHRLKYSFVFYYYFHKIWKLHVCPNYFFFRIKFLVHV